MKIDPVEKEKIRRRILKKWMQILAGLVVTLIALAAGRLVLLRDDYGKFRQFCKAIPKGQLLENIRVEALNHGYQWNADPDPSGFSENPAFVVRPTFDWPYRFGCRVNASHGFVVSVDR